MYRELNPGPFARILENEKCAMGGRQHVTLNIQMKPLMRLIFFISCISTNIEVLLSLVIEWNKCTLLVNKNNMRSEAGSARRE